MAESPPEKKARAAGNLEDDMLALLALDEQSLVEELSKLINVHGKDAIEAWKDGRSKHKHRLVHVAASKNMARLLETLQGLGFDINTQRDSDSCTPLHLALFYKKPKAIKTLHKLGADITIKNSYGEDCSKKYETFVASFDNIIWLDLEMTNGFYGGPGAKILEAAIIITDKDLNELDRGQWVFGGFAKEELEAMPEFHQQNFRDTVDGGEFPPLPDHPGNGLFSDMLKATQTKDDICKEMLALVLKHCPERACPLGGNSIQCDREVLLAEMPDFTKCLNHQIIDVSSFVGAMKRWLPDKLEAYRDSDTRDGYDHRAINDAASSIKQMRWMREHLLVAP